jgi:hypothetical protein
VGRREALSVKAADETDQPFTLRNGTTGGYSERYPAHGASNLILREKAKADDQSVWMERDLI